MSKSRSDPAILRRVKPSYVWGEALEELDRFQVAAFSFRFHNKHRIEPWMVIQVRLRRQVILLSATIWLQRSVHHRAALLGAGSTTFDITLTFAPRTPTAAPAAGRR